MQDMRQTTHPALDIGRALSYVLQSLVRGRSSLSSVYSQETIGHISLAQLPETVQQYHVQQCIKNYDNYADQQDSLGNGNGSFCNPFPEVAAFAARLG